MVTERWLAFGWSVVADCPVGFLARRRLLPTMPSLVAHLAHKRVTDARCSFTNHSPA